MEPTLKVAKKFPDVKFEHATGYKTADNVTTYNAKFHEGRYVIGQIAAKMSKTGTAGYIVSFPIPEVVAGINAFMLGAQIGQSRFQGEDRLGEYLVRSGQGSRCRQGAVQPGRRHHRPAHRLDRAAADCRGAGQARLRPGFRHDQFAPKAQLTAIVDSWAPYYIRRVKAVHGRHLEIAAILGRHGRRHGRHRALTPTCRTMWPRWPPRPQAAIKAGKLHPFTGPITKQDGTVVGEAGKPLPDGDILGMNWYVKGVDDKLPQ